MKVGSAFSDFRAQQELNTIASEPDEEHVFAVNNFDALKGIQDQLQDKIFAIEGTTGAFEGIRSPSPTLCFPNFSSCYFIQANGVSFWFSCIKLGSVRQFVTIRPAFREVSPCLVFLCEKYNSDL